jgi:hypothetical protein
MLFFFFFSAVKAPKVVVPSAWVEPPKIVDHSKAETKHVDDRQRVIAPSAQTNIQSKGVNFILISIMIFENM